MQEKSLSSKAVHGGAHVKISNRPEAMPIFQTSVFTFEDVSHMESYFQPGSESYLYSRNKNPNQTALEQVVASLEGGEEAVVTSSGMSSILCGVLTYVQAGDHILCSSEIYGVTGSLMEKELSRLGVEFSFADFSQIDHVRESIQSNTKVFITEVVTNPLLTVIDIRQIAELAHSRGCKLIVDNTFTSPYLIQPLKWGADMVVHSATKYINGHNDMTGGVVISGKDAIRRTREIVVTMGCSLGAFEAWLAQRGAKTFSLRMKQHCENGMKVAEFLQSHPKVERVYYPGLSTHPTYPIGCALLNDRFGGMISFKVADDLERVDAFFQSLNMINLAPSLAGVATTLSHPLKTSHRAWDKEKQKHWGITMGLLRLSVGIEDPEDIIQDLNKGLENF